MRVTARQVDRGVRRARARAETRQPRYESAIRSELRRLFALAASRFAGFATEHLTAAGEGPGWTPPADDELLALDEIVRGLRSKSDPVRQSAVADYFATFGASPGIRGIRASWDVTNPLIAHHLERVGSQITEVSETTRTNVRGIVARAYAEGLSIPDTAALIRSAGGDLSASRAALIARTEFVGLVNGGSLAAVQVVTRETGDNYLKRWLTAPGAENPRHEDYDDLDGQTVPLDGMFVVGGELLAYPGDPDGEPAEVCNCRCDVEYVEQRGSSDDSE